MARDHSILRRPVILVPLVFVLVASLVAITASEASARHKRFRRKQSLPETFVGPDRFACLWAEPELVHQYLCAGDAGPAFRLGDGAEFGIGLDEGSGIDPPNPDVVSDLANPLVFTCTNTGPPGDLTQVRNRDQMALFDCRYRHLHSRGGRTALVTHRFPLSEMVLVAIGEEQEGLTIWVPPHPPVTNSRAA
jgi:hypothetical protein